MSETAVAGCPSCGAAVAAGDRFCEACGETLGRNAPNPVAAHATCPSCGATAGAVDGYCGVCGMRQPAPRDRQELSAPGVGGVSDRGRRHFRNEDAMAVALGEAAVVAVVCDGVSSTQRSDEASQAAADAAATVLAAGDPTDPDHVRAYEAARDAVLAVPTEAHPDLGPPSCTYLAAVVTDAAVSIAALGDCRAYWAGAGDVRQLTTDDSWATEQIRTRQVSAGDAHADPRAHMITRWIASDADPSWEPALVPFEPPGAGRLLLVSDGLWNHTLEAGRLAAAMEGAGPAPLDLARHLVAYANRCGGEDNITVVVVELPLAARPASASTGDGAP